MTKTTSITHYVMETAFHGGSIISRHQSLRAADAVLSRIQSRHRECACGGGVVVTVEEYDDLPLPCDASSPYDAARRAI